MVDNLGIIDKKILTSMIKNMNDKNIVVMKNREIAESIGYKITSGGSVTSSLKILIAYGKIVKLDKWTYRVVI